MTTNNCTRWMLAVGLWTALAIPAMAADNYRPKVGEPHRAFVLPNIDTGRAVSLKDYRGKKVLLFHFASW